MRYKEVLGGSRRFKEVQGWVTEGQGGSCGSRRVRKEQRRVRDCEKGSRKIKDV